MTAIKSSDVDRIIANPAPAYSIFLVFGPDTGLVRERVDALVRASVDDPGDPFALARIEGDELVGNPTRLVEEAHTVPLFGGRRAVLVRAGSRNIGPAIEAVLNSPSPECRIIIEAGNLTKSSPLRVLCEKAKVAAAVPCYPDNERALASLIDEEMRANHLTIGSDARDELIALLGADRLASRNEIRKLVLYAQGKKTIGLDDVIAVVTDASQIALDGLVDAVFAGQTAEADNEFGKARASGSSPAAIVSAAIRQVANLHKMKLAIESGDSIEFTMRRAAPPVHFSRERAVSEALRAWTPVRLVRAMEQLAEASLDMRRNSPLAESIAQRTLLSLARNARKAA